MRRTHGGAHALVGCGRVWVERSGGGKGCESAAQRSGLSPAHAKVDVRISICRAQLHRACLHVLSLSGAAALVAHQRAAKIVERVGVIWIGRKHAPIPADRRAQIAVEVLAHRRREGAVAHAPAISPRGQREQPAG